MLIRLQYLLRGPSIVLDGENMPEVSKHVVAAITRRASTRENLRELHLRSLDKVPDATFASVIEKLPVLRVLDLGGCAKVAAQTVHAAAACCSHLNVLNVNHTAVPPVALAPILQKCPDLTVLKVAGIPSWTDANATKLLIALGLKDDPALRFPNLRTLKLKLTPVGDQVLNTILEICPGIRRLDVSFTNIQRPASLIQTTSLEKLSLTSTAMSSADMLKTVTGMTGLRSLALGALGRKGGSSIAVANTSVMTMTDETLRKLTKALTGCERLASVNLAGNTKLGSVSGSALTSFVGQIGRNCEALNLSGIPGLRSAHLEGLLGETAEESVSPLRELALNNTGIDDAAAPFISTCKSLQTLEVGSTKLTRKPLATRYA
ncbi:hypothetical protein PHLGIDRAFT_98774 [Phlebiopsis gigantea 11061_1 CR5-6]|uniref:RNI-like protein n=1 Tax=Phlebiopsis gigantea (strain 11061_1 CR5-6) TaxID=745531 RepID=A0A0C3P2A8_PHLG1|nr:hypothetical protein PHLGIDRAFT_98774 [Phlebiopsis gigantea 11061_1 CR5-6]